MWLGVAQIVADMVFFNFYCIRRQSLTFLVACSLWYPLLQFRGSCKQLQGIGAILSPSQTQNIPELCLCHRTERASGALQESLDSR